jgi:hypothetical protein
MLRKSMLVIFLCVLAILVCACKSPTPTFTPGPTPEISVIQGPDVISEGESESFSVTVNMGATYEWSSYRKGVISDPSQIGILYTPPDEGDDDLIMVTVTVNGTDYHRQKEIKINRSDQDVPVQSSGGEPAVATVPDLSEVPEVPSTSTPEPVCVLENFEDGVKNNWWSPNPTVFKYGVKSEPVFAGEGSFGVEYTKSDTYQFIAFEISTDCDFSKATKLQVWVYGDVKLLLKLEDGNMEEHDISTKSADKPDGWTQLVYNYQNMGEQLDLSNITQAKFFVAPDDTSASGEFYFDEIVLLP